MAGDRGDPLNWQWVGPRRGRGSGTASFGLEWLAEGAGIVRWQDRVPKSDELQPVTRSTAIDLWPSCFSSKIMAKLTVTEIKKKIAALEAKAVRLAAEETSASVGKVRSLMKQLGVTLEHLSSTVVRKGTAVKKAILGGQPAATKRTGKGVAKYRDPKTGATWSGFGRAPGWIAGAANRDAFLVGRAGSQAAKEGAKAAAGKKKASAKKVASKTASVKKAVKTSVKRAGAATKNVASKTAAPAASKKTPSVKGAAASKKVARKAAAKKATPAVSIDAAGSAEGSLN